MVIPKKIDIEIIFSCKWHVKLNNIPALAVRPQVPVPVAPVVRPQVPVPDVSVVRLQVPVPDVSVVRPQVPVPVASAVRPQVSVWFPAPSVGWSVPA